MFQGTKIKSIVIPSNVEEIKSEAFCECSKLENVRLNEGLKKIGSEAFVGTKIKKITINSNYFTGITHENLYSSKNNHYRKKSAALPAAALPFAAADRDWNRTARTFLPKSSLAIGQSGSAALPLPRVPPFLFYIMSLFCVYIFHA